MARLTLASVDYPVAVSGVRYDDVTKRRRVWSGDLATSFPTAVGTLRVWNIQTEILTRSEATTLLGVLTAPGTITANGETVGGSSVTVRATSVAAQEIFEDMVLVSFELWEET